MECKHTKNRSIYVILCLAVMLITAAIAYRIDISNKEQYYRDFYRADLEITRNYLVTLQTIYDEVMSQDYDKEQMLEFAESTLYKDAVQQMEAQINARETLYSQYTVVDFAALERIGETREHVQQFFDWVRSQEFDPQYAEDYFFLLGLRQDPMEELAHIQKWLSDPGFPDKSDNYVNGALGKTMLVTDFHSSSD